MLLVYVWDQICTAAAEDFRTEILANVKALRAGPPALPTDTAYRRLEQASEIHRQLIGYSASDYRLWLVGSARRRV